MYKISKHITLTVLTVIVLQTWRLFISHFYYKTFTDISNKLLYFKYII